MQEKPALLQKLFNRFIYNPMAKTRSLVSDLFLKHIYNPIYSSSGDIITTENGSRIDAVFTAVNTIAREIASTPVDIKQDSERGKIARKDVPQYRLISSRPNNLMTAYSWIYSNVFCYLTWGDSFNLIVRNANFQPVELIPLMPWHVKIVVENNEVYYIYKNGEPIPSRDILHFKAYSVDGVNGVSPISWNAQLIGSKINQQNYSNNSLGNKPNGFITGDLTDEQMDQISDSFRGRMNEGKIPYINGIDAKYIPISIPPNDAQFIETSKYTDQKIYGIYNLPPTFAQDYEQGVKANAEQQALTLVKHTLINHYMIIEQECNEKLFSERNKTSQFPMYVKFNQWGKLRGDIQSTNDMIRTNVTLGIWNGDEVREKIYDMPKQEGGVGEKYYHQGAMMEKGLIVEETKQIEE